MKIRYFFILPLMAVVTFFVSCGDNDEPVKPITPTELVLTPPTGYMKAEPDIIGVDSKGELTLDGWRADNHAYVVFFKWGSLIAMKGEAEDDEWGPGITDIAWVPKEYKSKLGNITNYASVSYVKEVFPTDSPAEGLGDPCHFAKKDGVAGYYRMPTGNPYEQFTDAGWVESGGMFGQRGRESDEGQFYPAAGGRSAIGTTGGVGSDGYYWSGTMYSTYGGCNLSFTSSYVNPRSYYNYTLGLAVRCVRQE